MYFTSRDQNEFIQKKPLNTKQRKSQKLGTIFSSVDLSGRILPVIFSPLALPIRVICHRVYICTVEIFWINYRENLTTIYTLFSSNCHSSGNSPVQGLVCRCSCKKSKCRQSSYKWPDVLKHELHGDRHEDNRILTIWVLTSTTSCSEWFLVLAEFFKTPSGWGVSLEESVCVSFK